MIHHSAMWLQKARNFAASYYSQLLFSARWFKIEALSERSSLRGSVPTIQIANSAPMPPIRDRTVKQIQLKSTPKTR